MLSSRDQILQHLQHNLIKAQARMKSLYDKKRLEISFAMGDWVLMKLKPCRQHSLALRKNQKLGMRYFGPFQIT